MLRRDLLASGLAIATSSSRAGAARAQGAAPAAEGPTERTVERKVFELGEYTTRAGAVIPNLRIGYQSLGRLNAEGSNAVLICHGFGSDGHAFGRLEPNGPAGTWDAIIGSGRAIDTDRTCVIAADSLVNVNVPSQRSVTTGPASINPATGRPYGMDFPVVSLRDFVEVQKKLLDSLGVKRLALVAGPNAGAMQVVEWAAAWPDFVERCMPVNGGAALDGAAIGWLSSWEAPIRLDPNWRNGDYYGAGREAPLRGLTEAWKLVMLNGMDRAELASQGRQAVEGQNPARNIADRFAVEKLLNERGLARARTTDANSFLYTVRANQLYLNEYPNLQAALAHAPRRWLVVAGPHNPLAPAEGMRELTETLGKAGKAVQTMGLPEAPGSTGMAPLGNRIRAFLGG